ncbi:MAG TPA: alpha-L-rhamnosidase C-terminal domain-containing protein [Lacunisphaera sp.]
MADRSTEYLKGDFSIMAHGISAAKDRDGRLFIRLPMADGVDWSSIRWNSARGLVAIDWSGSEGFVTLKIDLPAGVTALFALPKILESAALVTEGNERVSENVTAIAGQPGQFFIQPGHYVFKLPSDSISVAYNPSVSSINSL